MLTCSICKRNFKNADVLIGHLKLLHGCSKNSIYQCCEDLCHQSFQNVSAFKKHLCKVHFKTTYCELQRIVPKQNVSHSSTEIEFTASSKSEPNIRKHDKSAQSDKCAEERKSVLFNSLVHFLLLLHNKNNFARKDVLTIHMEMKNLIILPFLLYLENMSENFCSEDCSKVGTFIELYKETLQSLSSEHKLLQYLFQKDLYCKPTEFIINKHIGNMYKSGSSMLTEKVDKGILLPLKYQFRKVFEQDKILQECTQLIEKYRVDNSTIRNFVQGKLWEEKTKLYNGKILIPYFLYIDDFEINNPLGSHAGSQTITAIYYTFPTLDNNSKLNQIYLAALLKSVDIKNYGNDITMNTLIQNIISLEVDGITLQVSGEEKQVFFVLGLVLGDNLGLNKLLDFSKSFSANYYCSFCEENKHTAATSSLEDASRLRNEQNYNGSIQTSENGTTKNSLLNNIPSFHITKNFAVDLMHDIFEGIAHYNLANIISYCMTKGFFSLDEFNELKRNFSYGETEIGNVCKDVLIAHIKNKRFNTSAREMWTLIHHFTLLVGHLIPTNDKVWKFTGTFIKIVDYLLLPTFTEEQILELVLLIKAHNELYIELFHENLKPKYHFLIHYPRIIRNSGPPKFYWSFRFESKHRELKSYAKVITSRKNILSTLATKYQLKFAANIMYKNISLTSYDDSHKLRNENTEFITKNLNISENDFSSFSQVLHKGIRYKSGQFLTMTKEALTTVYCILKIIIAFEDDIYVMCSLSPSFFNDHYIAYEVQPDETEKNEYIYSLSSFDRPPIHIQKLPNSKFMIRPKFYFSN